MSRDYRRISFRRLHEVSPHVINLFYLVPEFRGQGFGKQLDRHASHFFKDLGCKSARLSVSPENLAAMRFYFKQGWIDLGQRDDVLEVHYLEETMS